MRTATPAAFVIVTTTSSAPLGTETPKLAAPEASVRLLVGTCTERPIIDDACVVAFCVSMLDIVVFNC